MLKKCIQRNLIIVFFTILAGWHFPLFAQGEIIDHQCTDITKIPEAAINQAKENLHIGYGHTSHGSQLTTGMTGLVSFANGGGLGLSLPNDIFVYNNGGTDGALDLHDYAMGGDCGYYPQWVNNTRAYLDNPDNSDVNLIIWSWCGQASGYSEQDMIDKYLTPMSQLEKDYPSVTFIYMTGHSDGSGDGGNLHIRNQQIRNFCVDNNKVLYDFYDIECYDPDDNYYGDKRVNDGCNYDSNGDGTRDKNWATDWQTSHTQDVDWYNCNSAHSQPLNANRKAYAAWWLWAVVAGWDQTTAVENNNNSNIILPESFMLFQNYPNPFNPVTTIRYQLRTSGNVDLTIYNIMGQKITSLVSGRQSKGIHQYKWNAMNLPSGEYICQLNFDGSIQRIKLLLLK